MHVPIKITARGAVEDLVLGNDDVVSVEFSDVHLLLGIAVRDVAATETTPSRSFDDVVSVLRRANCFVVALPRPAGVDYVNKTLNHFRFDRINYRIDRDGAVAELRFVRGYHIAQTEKETPQHDPGTAA